MSDKQTEVRVRRAPKFGAFMVVGGGVGLIATLTATSLFPVDPGVGFGALAAYFSLFGITAGVTLGALIALLLDRRSSKRSRIVSAERETVEAVEGGADGGIAPAQLAVEPEA